MKLIACTHAAHAPAMLEILNEIIVHSTAIYDYRPRSQDSMNAWFAAKTAGNFPVIGAVDDGGELLGFTTYGTFRAWPGYKYTVEHSVYVHDQHRGKGVGRVLLQRIIATATEQQYHVMVGGIDMDNDASIALHEKLGFVRAGTIRQAGFKFGRWLDLGFYQLVLSTPAHPVEG